MGLNSSQVEIDQLEIEVNKLKKKGLCKFCVQRYLSLDKPRLNKYYPISSNSHSCPTCNGILNHIDDIKSVVTESIGLFSYHDVQIELPTPLQEIDKSYCEELHLQTSCNIKNFLRAKLNSELPHAQIGPTLILSISKFDKIKCQLRWPDFYIVGKYIKNSRRVSHSRNFQGISISSIEKEIINHLSPYVISTQLTFESAGREDMDVRMMGTGRPFCIKIYNPLPLPNTNPKDIISLINDISKNLPNEIICKNGIEIFELKILEEKPFLNPKHIKNYRCIISSSEPVSKEMLNKLLEIENLIVYQKTPLRVAQRRPMKIREKMILKMNYKQISNSFFILDLITSGGTYIKEFVHSDFNRTNPSLGFILSPNKPIQCQLLQLDVISVGN